MPGAGAFGWLLFGEYALPTGVSAPEVPSAGGRVRAHIRGEADLRAPSAFVRGTGTVRVQGAGRLAGRAPAVQVQGGLRVAGCGRVALNRARVHGFAYAANPGEAVVVIEAGAEETLDVVVTH